MITHCPQCGEPVSVANEAYCANNNCRWNNLEWTKDETTGEHQLCFEHGFYVVYKSEAGDWCAGWQPDTEPCIKDETFEYFDTWQQARNYCEGLQCHKE